MALLADQSADASSNLVVGGGTNSLTFTMPGNVAIDVRSVVATINNAAGADTTAKLTIRDQSGVVIATKTQGEVIPAADTGTATFALRLSDDTASGTAAGFIKYDFLNTGNWLEVFTTGTGPLGEGILLDSSNGMLLENEGGAFNIIDNGTGLSLTASAGNLTVDASAGDVVISSNAGDVELIGQNNNTLVVSATAVTLTEGVLVTLAVGKTLEVRDHTSQPIFRVDEDGDLHGLTGKALTFDL